MIQIKPIKFKIIIFILFILFFCNLTLYTTNDSDSLINFFDAIVISLQAIFGNFNIVKLSNDNQKYIYLINLICTIILWGLLATELVDLFTARYKKNQLTKELFYSNKNNIFIEYTDDNSEVVDKIVNTNSSKPNKKNWYTQNHKNTNINIKTLPSEFNILDIKSNIYIDIANNRLSIKKGDNILNFELTLLSAKYHLKSYPLYYQILEKKKAPIICFIGKFNYNMEYLFQKLAVNFQNPFGKPTFYFFVENFKHINKINNLRWKELEETVNLIYVDIEDFPESNNFYFDFVYFMEISQYNQLQYLDIIKISNNNLPLIFSNVESNLEGIYPLADSEEMYQLENLLSVEYKKVHENYKKNTNNLDMNWDNLSIFTKNSNISAAEFKQNFELLNEAGFTLVEMAKVEHLRWNTFHYVHGWQKMPLQELYDKYKKGDKKFHKDEKQRIHVCLVEWEELLDIDNFFIEKLNEKNPNFQQLDIDNVRNILG